MLPTFFTYLSLWHIHDSRGTIYMSHLYKFPIGLRVYPGWVIGRGENKLCLSRRGSIPGCFDTSRN